MKYLKVGVITTTHGLKGGVKVFSLTDTPQRFQELRWVYLNEGGERIPIQDVKIRPKDIIVYLQGIDSIEKAEKLRGKPLLSDESQRVPLEEDRYYVADLVGLRVVLPDGEHVGTVTRVMETGAHDIYVVEALGNGKEWMVPAVKEFVKEINISKRVMVVDPIEGLLP